MNAKHDRFAHLTITDLQLIARARGINLPADTNRDDLVNLLGDIPVPGESAAVGETPKRSALNAPTGCWTSLSVGELRTVAREHGINVPVGVHRHELVGLLIEHDVSRPSRQRRVGHAAVRRSARRRRRTKSSEIGRPSCRVSRGVCPLGRSHRRARSEPSACWPQPCRSEVRAPRPEETDPVVPGWTVLSHTASPLRSRLLFQRTRVSKSPFW